MEPVDTEYEVEAPRLVKLRLPAPLVRAMDRAIASSAGAYLDRNEFVAESIRDRLLEEGQPTQIVRALVRSTVGREQSAETSPFFALDVAVAELPTWGAWKDRRLVHVAASGGGVSFGLHNRDLPTLWAFDRLVADVADAASAVAWPRFVSGCTAAAFGVGAWFEQTSANGGIRGGVGFPRPGAKAKASAERFVSGSIGSQKGDGPLFILGLAGLTTEGGLAPTEPGVSVLGELLAVEGFGHALPHPPAAWWRWLAHLEDCAPDEAAVWRKVLKVVSDGPTRAELNAEFPEWPGSRADTNCMGFVSRSREWGLIEPGLLDGRYQLTALGRDVNAQKGTLR